MEHSYARRAGQTFVRPGQSSRQSASGRSQPSVHLSEKTNESMGSQIGCNRRVVFRSGYQDAALLRLEQQHSGRTSGRPESLSRPRKFTPLLITSLKRAATTWSGFDRFRILNEARRQELLQKQKDRTISDKESKELIEVTRRLELAVKPTLIKDRIVDGEGRTVSLAEPAQNAKDREEQIVNGRRLFTERGCLACHSHAGTETASGLFLPFTATRISGRTLAVWRPS